MKNPRPAGRGFLSVGKGKGLFRRVGCGPPQRSSSQSTRCFVSAQGENSARFLAPPRPTQTALLGLRGDPIDCHAHVAAKNGFHLFRACGRELCEAFATALNPGSPADGRDFLRAEGVIPASGAFPGQGLPRRPGHPVPVQRPVQEMLQGQHRLVQQHGQAVANPQSPGPGLGQ